MTELRDAGTCLITGVNGFIGSRVFAQWKDMGINVVGWSRQDVDLTNFSVVRERLVSLLPDTIVHLAAASPPQFTKDWTDAAREVAMLSHIAEAMPDTCRLLAAGSMAEYGYAGTFGEGDLRKPNTAYGFAKLACSDHAVALRTAGHDVSLARLFGVFGAGEDDTRLIPTLIEKLKSNQPVSLSDGDQLRDFVYVGDVATILLKMATTKVVPAVLNVGTGQGVTVRDVCEKIADYLGADRTLLQFGAVERRAVDEDMLVADTRLLQKYLGENPEQRFLGNLDFIDEFESLSSELAP